MCGVGDLVGGFGGNVKPIQKTKQYSGTASMVNGRTGDLWNGMPGDTVDYELVKGQESSFIQGADGRVLVKNPNYNKGVDLARTTLTNQGHSEPEYLTVIGGPATASKPDKKTSVEKTPIPLDKPITKITNSDPTKTKNTINDPEVLSARSKYNILRRVGRGSTISTGYAGLLNPARVSSIKPLGKVA